MLTEHTTSYHSIYCLSAADTSSSCSSSTTVHPTSAASTNIVAPQSSLIAAKAAPLSSNVSLSHVDPEGSVLQENLFELPQPQASGISSVLPVASST